MQQSDNQGIFQVLNLQIRCNNILLYYIKLSIFFIDYRFESKQGAACNNKGQRPCIRIASKNVIMLRILLIYCKDKDTTE